MLADGIYDALIVDAEAVDEGDGDAGESVMRIELAITSGEHKGEVVVVRGPFPGRSPFELLAAPARLTVAEGRPSVTLDD